MFITYEKFIKGVLYLKPQLAKTDAKRFLIRLIVCLVSAVFLLTWMFFRVFESDYAISIGIVAGGVLISQTLRSILDDVEYLDIWYSVAKFWIVFIIVSVVGSFLLWYFF